MRIEDDPGRPPSDSPLHPIEVKTPMPLDNVPELLRLLEAGIEKYRLDEIRAGILAAAEPCLLLHGGDEAEDYPVGGSRLGGLPDLHPSAAWPDRHGWLLPFLAQIDLVSLPRLGGSPLPAGGLLSLFGTGEDDARAHFHDGPRDGLARREVDENRIKNDWSDDRSFTPVPIVGATPAVSLTHEGVCRALGLWPDDDDEDGEPEDLPPGLAGRLIKLIGALNPSDSYDSRLGDVAGQLLGFPSFPDASPRHARLDGHEGDDWMNLLEIQSVGSMMWSDCGMLNLFIRRSALARRDFSELYASVYSG